jgi:hypothetical protein
MGGFEKQGEIKPGITPELGPGPLESDTIKRAADHQRLRRIYSDAIASDVVIPFRVVTPPSAK